MTERRYDAEPLPLLGVATRFATGAGAPVTVRIAVTNAAAGPRVLSVAAIGTDPTWGGAPRRTSVLAPGGSEVVEIVLTPPVGTVPAQYPLVVAVQALDPETGRPTGTGTGNAETTLVVDPRAQLDLDLRPRELSMVATRRFQVVLRNGGAEPASVRLLLKSSTGVSLQVQQQEVRVPSGGTVRVRGRARVRRPQMIGARIPHAFSVTARGSESIKHLDSQVLQRSAIGPGILKIVALVAIVAVWAGAAIVFIPALAERVQTSSEESAATTGPESQGGEETGEEGAEGAEGAGEEGAEGAGGGDAEPAADEEGLQLSGTVAGDQPDDVSVTLAATSLVDEAAQGGTGVGVDSSELDGTGMRLASAFVESEQVQETPDRSVRTAEDGTWAFPAVRSPGYYLVTFAKTGYQTQRFVIDSSNEAAAEPLEIDLEPGQGSLQGRITGPDGPVDGASVTISDGTNTVTTTSNSRRDAGGWSIDGLSTPGTYVVTASHHNMSSESRVIELGAGESGTASLDLVEGVATVTGVVKVPRTKTATKKQSGLTVTVSDGQGNDRIATTLSDPLGGYSIPGVPVPGTYTMTVQGDGYQSQTKTIRIPVDEGERTENFSLNSAYGTVSGTVRQAASAGTTRAAATRPARGRKAGDDPLGNVGLTLSNAEHTYKTTSSTTDLGRYGFSGVAPGTYVLTTQYFGMVVQYVTVEVTAGGYEDLDLTLREQAGAGVPADATIEGSVIDAASGKAITTCGVDEACLTATVTDPGVEKADGTVTDGGTYCDRFGNEEGYTLPDPDSALCDGQAAAPTGSGLHAGRYTVSVTAPGYEAGRVKVDVGQSERVEAPLLELYTAPGLRGTLSAVVNEAPEGRFPTSCVWLVRKAAVTAGTVDLATLPDCGPTRPPACKAGESLYDGVSNGPTSCVVTDATGNYYVQAATTGEYVVVIDPASEQMVAPTNETITLTRGGTLVRDVAMDRFGKLTITVMKPDPATPPLSEGLVTAEGAKIRADPQLVGSTEDETWTTGPDGRVTVTGLRSQQTYTFHGALVVPVEGGDPDDTTIIEGSATGSVPYNETNTITLKLTEPISAVVGQVTSTVDGHNVVEDATVTIDIANGYSESGTATYGEKTVLTSDGSGCFAIHSSEEPQRLGTCAGDTWESDSIASRSIAGNRARSVVVSAPGYVGQTFPWYAFSTIAVNDFPLVPETSELAAPVAVLPAGSATWANATVAVTKTSDGSHPVWKVTNDAGAGVLGLPGGGEVLAGSYQVTISLSGFTAATKSLWCEPGESCTWGDDPDDPEDPPTLLKDGSLALTVEDASGDPVHGAAVIRNGSGVDTDENGLVTIDHLKAGDGLDPADITVRGPGFRWGVLTATGAVTTDCRTASGDFGVEIPPGDTAACTVTLNQRLSTVSGTLFGVLGSPTDDEAVEEELGGVRLTLDQCTTATCTSFVTTTTTPNWKQLSTTTTLPSTSGSGGGRFTFTGTKIVEGLESGYYQVRVPNVPAGYELPADKIIVHVPAGLAPQTRDVRLSAKAVAVTVRVTDKQGRPVTDATVWLGKGDTGDTPGEDPDDVKGQTTAGSNAHTFADVVPGRWTVYAEADGIPLRGQSVDIGVDGSTTRDIALTVTRSGGSLSGRAITRETGSATGLADAVVTLSCAPLAGDTSIPVTPSRFCGAGADDPALALDDDPLTITTEADGTFTLDLVPSGRFAIRIEKAGYGTFRDTVVVEDTDQTIGTDLELQPVRRTVKLTIEPSHPDGDLSGASAELVGTDGTTLDYLPTSTVTSTGALEVTFTAVRWGCYDLEVTRPARHHGTLGAVTGIPRDPELCPETTAVTVPNEYPTDTDATTAPALTGTAVLAEGIVTASVKRTPWNGHARPAVTVTVSPVDDPSTRYELLTTSNPSVDPSAATTTWLPRGTYTVDVGLAAADRPYWDVSVDRDSVVAPTTIRIDETGAVDAVLGLFLTERTFRVAIKIPTLPSGETPTFQIGKGNGESGNPPASSAVTYDAAAGEWFVLLPHGSWVIEGAWTTGPYDLETVEVTGPTSVTLAPQEDDDNVDDGSDDPYDPDEPETP